MSAEVEEQIAQLRGQLLHSEQEKDLMRLKLEQEKSEREKAQKQVRAGRRSWGRQHSAAAVQLWWLAERGLCNVARRCRWRWPAR